MWSARIATTREPTAPCSTESVEEPLALREVLAQREHLLALVDDQGGRRVRRGSMASASFGAGPG
jgi:hypothetical protein